MATISVTGRHVRITRNLRKETLGQAAKLSRYFDRIRKVAIIVSLDGDQHSVEMVVSTIRKSRLFGKVRHRVYLTALTKIVDKMERQLTKFKEKMVSQRMRNYRSRLDKRLINVE